MQRIEVLRLSSLEPLYALRLQVLRPGGPPESARWPLDDHPESTHLGAFIDSRCVGIASVVPEDGWRLRGMAVDPSLQGCGVGRELVRTLQRDFGARGAGLWCKARIAAVEFYLKLGFTLDGEPFEIEGIGLHYTMRWTPEALRG